MSFAVLIYMLCMGWDSRLLTAWHWTMWHVPGGIVTIVGQSGLFAVTAATRQATKGADRGQLGRRLRRRRGRQDSSEMFSAISKEGHSLEWANSTR